MTSKPVGCQRRWIPGVVGDGPLLEAWSRAMGNMRRWRKVMGETVVAVSPVRGHELDKTVVRMAYMNHMRPGRAASCRARMCAADAESERCSREASSA